MDFLRYSEGTIHFRKSKYEYSISNSVATKDPTKIWCDVAHNSHACGLAASGQSHGISPGSTAARRAAGRGAVQH
jgi:hypothetical protein